MANGMAGLFIGTTGLKTAQTALKQIKEKNYPESLFKYSGKILLIGISYDKKTKEHQCVIEEI